VAEALGIRVAVLLCPEAMFNERERAYGKRKASLIVPRALKCRTWGPTPTPMCPSKKKAWNASCHRKMRKTNPAYGFEE
jgi:hypothetical protein